MSSLFARRVPAARMLTRYLRASFSITGPPVFASSANRSARKRLIDFLPVASCSIKSKPSLREPKPPKSKRLPGSGGKKESAPGALSSSCLRISAIWPKRNLAGPLSGPITKIDFGVLVRNAQLSYDRAALEPKTNSGNCVGRLLR
jgi:hypothetical protein